MTTLLELLQSGRVEEFNARRGQRVQLDLFAADLSGLELADVDLSNANLEKADLSGADLSGANLSKAILTGADLTGAQMEGVVAVKARFREAYLGTAKAAGGEFAGADFADADLSGFVAPRARFAGARLKDAVLANAVLPEADFAEAKLSGADLRGAILTGASFASAELARANASGADMTRAKLMNARMAGVVLRGTRLPEADLSSADLSSADLTGADLTGAVFDKADLFEAQIDEGALARVVQAPEPEATEAPPDDEADLHFEDPSTAVIAGCAAAVWENAEDDESFKLRAVVCAGPRGFTGRSCVIPAPIEAVLARFVLPAGDGFLVVAFVERPAGTELLLHALAADGTLGPARAVRLGYTPVVKPVLTSEPDGGFLIFGIARQGGLCVHRCVPATDEAPALTELVRAPAGTYRGFCGRNDPVLLGKGGTVALVRRDGIGRLLTAPAGYPGRLTAAAAMIEGERATIGLAWAGKNEKGLRASWLPGGDPVLLDKEKEVVALDLAAVGDRWLVVWTREADDDDEPTIPWACWLPGGAPFPLLAGNDRVDVEDVRIAVGGVRPAVAMVTLGEELVVVEVGASGGTVTARIGT